MKNKQHTSKKHTTKLLYIVLMFIFTVIFLFSAYQIYTIIKDYWNSSAFYEDVRDNSPINTEDLDDSDKSTEQRRIDKERRVIKTKKLLAINPDYLGWIYIPDTNIDYPVVLGNDNTFYLTNSFKREYMKNGCLFMDYRCNADFYLPKIDSANKMNSIIYGHHMRDGSMFGKLNSYLDEDFFRKHATLYFLTRSGQLKSFKIYSAYTTSDSSHAYDLDLGSEDSINLFIEKSTESSLYKTGITPTVDDVFLTLSTCAYDFENARFVVHAILQR